ncbi:hypothetical protein VULLAG_LOCUS554 [Vulpes lagopus]
MARTGHGPRRPPRAAHGRGHRGMRHPPPPARLGLQGKKFAARLRELFKAQASPGLLSPLRGPHEGPRGALPALPGGPDLLLCMLVPRLLPAVRSPRTPAAAAAPRVQPPPAPPLRPA